MVTEQTIGPCPACGIGEFYEHTGHRWCNACGFMALPAVWDRLSGQAARIVELEAALSQIAMAETGSFEIVKMYPEDDGGWSCDVCERMQELARRALGEPTP